MFSDLAANRVEEFLAACSDQVLITVQGVSPMSCPLSPGQFPLWWEGLRRLAEDTLVTEVLLTLSEDISHVVILRHDFTRAGRKRRFDTVNRCTFRNGALAAWFSSPLERREYAEAWGLSTGERPSAPQTDPGCRRVTRYWSAADRVVAPTTETGRQPG
jgi:hypothetical protein